MLNKKYREQDYNNIAYETASNTKNVKVLYSVVDLSEELDNHISNKPEKESKAFAGWVRKYNTLVKRYGWMYKGIQLI